MQLTNLQIFVFEMSILGTIIITFLATYFGARWYYTRKFKKTQDAIMQYVNRVHIQTMDNARLIAEVKKMISED